MKEKYDFSKGKRGAIDPMPPGKTRITLYLNDEIIEWFRNTAITRSGGNYLEMINKVLKKYIEQWS